MIQNHLEGYMQICDLHAYLGQSKRTTYEYYKLYPDFPTRYRFSSRRVYVKVSEVDAWLLSRLTSESVGGL